MKRPAGRHRRQHGAPRGVPGTASTSPEDLPGTRRSTHRGPRGRGPVLCLWWWPGGGQESGLDRFRVTALAAVSRFHRAGSLPHFLERVTRNCNCAWSQFVWSVITSYDQHSTLGERETLFYCYLYSCTLHTPSANCCLYSCTLSATEHYRKLGPGAPSERSGSVSEDF